MATPTNQEKRPIMSESEPLPPPADDQHFGESRDTAAHSSPADASATGSPARSTKSDSPRDRFVRHVADRRESAGNHEAEETLWVGGYSAKAMTGWWLVLSAATIALLVGYFLVPQLTIGITLGIIAILWALVGGNYARMRLGYHYELTSQRFIHKAGLFTRRSDRIEVIDIDDVSYEQGPVQRLLGVGTIDISSSDRSDPELRLVGIEKVSQVAGLIDDVRRTERRRRSLHIESI